MYQQIFELHADIFKSISHPKRLEIIHLLRDKQMSVSEIQSMLDLPQANLSQHLQVLRENRIVCCHKQGKQIYYSISHPNFVKACDLIREVLLESHKGTDICNKLQENLSDLLPIGIDPICGMRLTPKTAAFIKKQNNTAYYFCASGCLEKFNIKNNDNSNNNQKDIS